eukprot:1193578-Prorocentrum_minimum.AAC.2
MVRTTACVFNFRYEHNSPTVTSEVWGYLAADPCCKGRPWSESNRDGVIGIPVGSHIFPPPLIIPSFHYAPPGQFISPPDLFRFLGNNYRSCTSRFWGGGSESEEDESDRSESSEESSEEESGNPGGNK